MNILVVGDSYMASSYFQSAFEEVEKSHIVEYVEVDHARSSLVPTESERLLREYEGSPDELVELAHGFEILVVHGAPVTEEVLASEGLGLVCCARGGPVNVDLDAASAHGIPVVTTPGKNAASVADQTLAFLIMLARRFPKAQRFLLEGGHVGASAFEGARFFGHDLEGHVLGLVGYGHVGRQVAARAVGFGMAILIHDPYLPAEPAEPVERVGSLEELLGRADFVSLHVRATADNENLFGAEEFAAMRPGAFFVNTARETLVDELALAEALSSGRMAGAALDVIRPRTDGRHPLLECENVVMTPHIGGATHETLLRGAGMVAEQILRFTAGEPLEHVANAAGVEA
jgi:D-3-phosphoglycerate dehydrogenase / 2-oxoglutarate reductase